MSSPNPALPTESIQSKFDRLEDIALGRVFERNWEIRTALLALISRKHHGQFGPPGVAKTMLVDEMVNLIDGLKPMYFRYLLTRFTTPPELFGPVSLQGLRNDVQRFTTTGKLPEAHVAFLDEIFKANSAILNALLTILNEGLFFNNGSNPNVPLSTVFCGSNELPLGAELAALSDRITIKHMVEPMRETGNVIRMLRAKAASSARPAPVLTWDEVLIAQTQAKAVEVSEIVFEKLAELRTALAREGIHPTERRLNDCIDVIKANAWRDNRTVADQDDLRPVEFILWENVKERPKVKELVLAMANPLDKEAQDVVDTIEKLAAEVADLTRNVDDQATRQTMGSEVYGKLQRCDERLDELLVEASKSPRQQRMVEEAKGRVSSVIEGLLFDLFQTKL